VDEAADMETYLNIAEWGPRRFGAEAAAQANFGKAAADCRRSRPRGSRRYCQAQRRYSADKPGPFVARQSQIIVDRLDDVRRDRLDSCIFQ
jgi:monofunctional biosynthetic peptidoglycan transglycosylase